MWQTVHAPHEHFRFRSSISIRAVLMNFANQTVWLKLSRWKRPLALHTPTSLKAMVPVVRIHRILFQLLLYPPKSFHSPLNCQHLPTRKRRLQEARLSTSWRLQEGYPPASPTHSSHLTDPLPPHRAEEAAAPPSDRGLRRLRPSSERRRGRSLKRPK